jgi:hypothetical protein
LGYYCACIRLGGNDLKSRGEPYTVIYTNTMALVEISDDFENLDKI